MKKIITILIAGGLLSGGIVARGQLNDIANDISSTELAQKYDSAPPELKAIYVREEAELKLTDIKNPELTSEGQIKDDVQVTIGDNTPAPRVLGIFGGGEKVFKPDIEMKRWNEVSFKLKTEKLLEDSTEDSIALEKDKVKYNSKKMSFEMHQTLDKEAYKYVWYLNEKPITNKVEFQMESKGLDFFYQPPLNEEFPESKNCSPTECDTDGDGVVDSFRPENVVGSYAVYHSTKGGMNDTYGKDYKVGKAFHIYRPHLIDANGLEAWGILHISDPIEILPDGREIRTYSVTLPDEIYNNGSYPIKSNDTFGYTSLGASSGLDQTATDTNNFAIRSGYAYTPSENGTLDKISFGAVLAVGTTDLIDLTVFLNELNSGGANSHRQIAKKEQLNSSFSTTAAFVDITMASEAFTPGVSYIINVVGDGADVNVASSQLRPVYDTTSSVNKYSEAISNGYVTLRDEDPWTPAAPTSVTRTHSIYATYTPISRTITTANFSYCRLMTMTAGGGSGGVATTTTLGFPLVATTTLSDLAATSSSGKIQKSFYNALQNQESPLDIVFGNEASCYANASIEALPHYFEKWATTTGEIAAWVQAPDISSTSAKTITMYYGNSAMTDNLNYPQLTFATSSYQKPIYQFDLNQKARAGNLTRDFFDLTYNQNHATSSGDISDTLRTGYIGNGVFFDGVNDGLLTVYPMNGLSTTTLNGLKDFTVLFMASSTGWGDGVEHRPVSFGGDTNNFIDVTKSSSNNFIGRYDAGATLDQAFASAAAYTGWKQFAMTGSKTKDQLKVFHNGAQISTTQTTLGTFSDAVAISSSYIGRASGGTYWSGTLDDVRLFATDLHEMDILTIFNNVINSARFWTFGNEETPTPPTPSEPSPYTDSFWDDI